MVLLDGDAGSGRPRDIVRRKIRRALRAAENALGVQSNDHPDGWGVAFYVDGAPHVTRSPTTALGDALFHRLSGVVSSQTVLAHVRKATQGACTVFNCHPFQHGRWVFAHNGDIPNFEARREALLGEVAPKLRRFILGDTDSELLFFVFLTELAAPCPPFEAGSLEHAISALRAAIRRVRALCDSSEPKGRSLLSVMATNGDMLIATQGGKELYFSTYKRRCSDRDTCASLSPVCEAPSKTGIVNHFVVSSEPLHGENVWEELAPGDIIGVDRDMRVQRAHLERANLPVVA